MHKEQLEHRNSFASKSPFGLVRKLIDAYRTVADGDRFIEAGEKISREGHASIQEVKRFYDPMQSYRAVSIPLQIAALAFIPYFWNTDSNLAVILYLIAVVVFHASGMHWILGGLRAVEAGRFDDIRSVPTLYRQAFIFSVCIDLIFIAFIVASTPEMILMQFASWGFAIVVLHATYYFNLTFASVVTGFNLFLLVSAAFTVSSRDPMLAMVLTPQNLAFPLVVIVVCAFTLRKITTIHYVKGIESQMNLVRAKVKVIESQDDVSRLNQQMALIANSSDHGIALIKADGVIELMNEQFRKIFAISSGVAAQTTRALIDNEVIDRKDSQFTYHHPSGQIYLVSNVVLDGEDIGLSRLLLLTDITDRTNEERNNARLERLGILGTLSSGIAHDFNNLLAIVQNRVDYIHVTNPSVNKDGDVDDIRHAISSGSALARQLLSYTHEIPLASERADLHELMLRTVDLARPTLGEKVTIEVIASTGVYIDLDTYILQVNLLNLIFNARDAMNGEGRIVITINDNGETVSIDIADEGVGIAPEKLGSVFEPFFTTKDRAGNAGLGLALAKSFVDKSGGQITIDSTLGEGTTVTINLPVASDAPAELSERFGLEYMTSTTANPKNDAKVAVIDDKEALVNSQVKLLSNWFPNTVGFTSIAQLVSTGDLSQYDVFLCDLLLDGESGVDVLRLLRSQGIETPVLFFSGNVPPEIRQEIDDIEKTVIMEKPVATARMVAELENALQGAAH